MDKLKPLLLEMFGHQNEFIERLEIGKELNDRVTHDFMDAVEAFFS